MRDSKPLVSIIIPVYNVETFLDECIDSAVNQTYTNIEMILIDDGSTDSSLQICEKWANSDARVKYLGQKNSGVAAARNTALDMAQGEYIAFLDSDDYYELDFIERAVIAIYDSGADLFIGSYNHVNENGEIIDAVKTEPQDARILSEKDIWQIQKTTSIRYFISIIAVWTKLYKRELFDSLRFAEGRICEDEEILHKILCKCDKIYYTERPVLNYRKTPGSQMHSAFSIKRLDLCTALLGRIKYFEEKEWMFLAKCDWKAGTKRLMEGYECLNLVERNNVIKLEGLRKQYENHAKIILSANDIGVKDKMQMIVFCKFFALYKFLWKVK